MPARRRCATLPPGAVSRALAPARDSDPTRIPWAFAAAPARGCLAAEARPKLVVLTHIVGDRSNEATYLDAVRAGGFGGHVAFGHDLDRF